MTNQTTKFSDVAVFEPHNWFRKGHGPRYEQLTQCISVAIQAGKLQANERLPSERELADLAEVSRVTVRRAVAQLVAEGLIEARPGAGSFVRSVSPKHPQSLTSLISFSENMAERGIHSASEVLLAGLFKPNQEEMITLGVASDASVARVRRLRTADDTPMAIELSALPEDILPTPFDVCASLYEVLRKTDVAPIRAMQRVSATNIDASDAELLKLKTGTAVLKIERIGYLANGRPIEFTQGIYRSDIYDFVAEIRKAKT